MCRLEIACVECLLHKQVAWMTSYASAYGEPETAVRRRFILSEYQSTQSHTRTHNLCSWQCGTATFNLLKSSYLVRQKKKRPG